LISINHFFVTFGELLITLYLIYLQFDWRASMVQSAALVLLLAVLFALSRVPSRQQAASSLRERFDFLRVQRPLLVLFILASCAVGIELALIGMITSFLMEFHAFTQVTSKLGLVAYLGGVAAGRVVLGFFTHKEQIIRNLLGLFALTALFMAVMLLTTPGTALMYTLLFLSGLTISIIFPLIITLTGLKYPQMSGTALGVLKLGIPVGGIVLPFFISVLAGAVSFQASLVLFPLFALIGFLLVYANRSLLQIEA
jgi:fucose permease